MCSSVALTDMEPRLPTPLLPAAATRLSSLEMCGVEYQAITPALLGLRDLHCAACPVMIPAAALSWLS